LYGEYAFNNYEITIEGDATTPTISDNILNISALTYGNININAVWDYQKYNLPKTMNAVNSGSFTDINGTYKSFDGYSYDFYNMSGSSPATAVSSISYTSGSGDVLVTLRAQSNMGYEFVINNLTNRVSDSIISYPFNADGSIADVPYDSFYYQSPDLYPGDLPTPLLGNSGIVNLYYKINSRMAGDISVGTEMKLVDYPIFVSMGAQISSFNYNGEKYNYFLWPNKYTYNNKTYYKLNGATFNVNGSFYGTITNIVTTDGYAAPDKTIDITGTSISTNEEIEANAFVNIPDAIPVTYHINSQPGTGVSSVTLNKTTYDVLTDTFTPSISAIEKRFGYDTTPIVYGNIYNGGTLLEDNLTAFAQVVKPSYNNYNYIISAQKKTYQINNYKIGDTDYLPYGLAAYTLNKTTYQISSSKQTVGVSYTTNSGYQMNTSNFVNVGSFYNSTGSSFYAEDQTYNTFNIPTSTVGDVIFKAPEPSPIQYFITNGNLTGINGINTVTYTPNNYYISNSETKQPISVGMTAKDGYKLSTDSLVITGSSTSEATNSSFKINKNGFGDITVVPATPLLNTYNLTITKDNIPNYTLSGIDTVTLDKTTYNVESLAFTPKIDVITYVNSGFDGYVVSPDFASIPQGSFGDKAYSVYANAVDFNINIAFDASIASFNYEGTLHYSTNPASITTYNVLQDAKPIILNDIVVKNDLYLPKTNFTIGTVAAGSTGDKSFSLSSALKTNSITINTLPEGYASSVPNVSSYTATNGTTKIVTLTHTVNPGYLQPTDNLIVSSVKNETGVVVSVTGINNRSFTIPQNSWGDIVVTLPNAPLDGSTRVVNFQNGHALDPHNNVPTGVNSTGFGISPTGYSTSDTFPLGFTVSANALPGYQNPTWNVIGGSNKSGSTFDMNKFNIDVPIVTVTGGDIIPYNMNIVKGAGIVSFNYGANMYTGSSKVETYNVLSTRTVRLTNINVINHLWNPVANYDAIVVTPGNTGDKTNSVSTALKTSNINKGVLPFGINDITFSMNTYQSVIDSQVIRTVDVSYAMNNGYSIPSNMNVTGSLNGSLGSVTITPPNANQFNIAPNTWGTLIVAPDAPSKITYTIDSGTLPVGMRSMSYSISSLPVTGYNISTSERTVLVTYTMNDGYTQPVYNPTVVSDGSSMSVINYRAFNIPINGYGNLTVTPGAIDTIMYNINVGTKPVGIDTMVITPNNYYVNSTHEQLISIDYTMNTG
jgi:hypothetical protein